MKRCIILSFLIMILFQCICIYAFAFDSTVKVGVYNNEPLLFIDSDEKAKGIFVDIVEYVASKEGWQLEYVTGTWQQCLSRLENNEIDILGTIAFSRKRDKLYDFNRENLLTNWGQLLVPHGSGIKQITDVKGKKVAVLTGDIHQEIFFQLAEKFEINCRYVQTDSYKSVLRLVEDKKADGGVVNRFFGMKYADQYNVDKSGVIFNPIKLYYAVPEGRNADLIETMDRYIISLKKDENSVYYNSLNKWLEAVSSRQAFPQWAKWTVAAVVGLAALLFGGNMILRSQVKARTGELHDELKRRKQSEQAVQLSHKRFFAVLNSIDVTIYVADMETYDVLFMNQHMIDSFGRDMTGEICWKVFRGESGPCAHCTNDKLIDKDGNPSGVYTWNDKNSVTGKWYINSDRAIQWTDGRLVRLQIATDITDFKKMESQLQQAQKMESIGTLAGGIAHDFNNILFPIIGHTEMLLADVPEDSPFRKDLNRIYASALRAKDLVEQILTFSRQGSNEPALMKMQPIIKEALKLIRSTIPTTIEINQDLNPDCGTIKADPTQIHQIVMNLCTNAYHAMEETGGEMNIRLKKVELEEPDLFNPDIKPGIFVCLSISDTGKGMDKNLTDKIFDPFFTTKETGKGTGMGLSVVHGIVQSMNGAIKVYSEPDKGTEFHVYLPIAEAMKEHQPTNAEAPIQGGTEHILFVDDEEMILQMETVMLERLGYQVTSRTSSLEALEAFRKNPDKFDMVITDMAMPNMSGDKLSVELTKIRPDIPVLLCTGFSETMSKEKAASMGIKGFLLKPIVMKNLDQKIREVLDK